MPTALPYLPSNKNIPELFKKIATARVPAKFTHEFLQQTVGLKGTNDRPLIPLLRTLGFLDTSGTPNAQYAQLKNPSTAKAALAAAIKRAYAPLFDSDENAHKLPADELKGLIAQVAGADEDMTGRISSTFNALVKLADFSAPPSDSAKPEAPDQTDNLDDKDKNGGDTGAGLTKHLRPEFHYNIQIHLPANGTEEMYLNIFNALRKVFE